MTLKKLFILPLIALLALVSACSDSQSYADLLASENKACNNYLSDQRVFGYEKRDASFDFETGEDAPFYQLDQDGNLYMRVVKYGTPDNFAKEDELIYFRFMRYNLRGYSDGELPTGEGNDFNVANNAVSFRFDDESSSSYTEWGSGIQEPLHYVPLDSEVEIVVKSQLGPYSEISYVAPYLYRIRYSRSQI